MQNAYTLLLPACNEEARIGRVIDYYAKYGRVIVIDNFSSDRTASIAKERGCEVIQIPNNGSVQTKEWMQETFSHTPTQYVLLLSCSEFIPPASLRRFEEVARAKSHDMVANVVISYTCGADIPLWGSVLRPAERRIERFFNKDEVDYDAVFIHAPFKTKGKGGTLSLPNDSKYNVAHLRDSDIRSLTRKHMDYAVVEAQQIIASRSDFRLWTALTRSLVDVVRYFRLPRAVRGVIARREVWGRIMMHFSIYFLVREGLEGVDINYSRRQSAQLWESLAASSEGEK